MLENTDDDVEPGDIVIYSELALPAKTELGAGSMTKRIATRRNVAAVSASYCRGDARGSMRAGAGAAAAEPDAGRRLPSSSTKTTAAARPFR